jgi:hypothetical protein
VHGGNREGELELKGGLLRIWPSPPPPPKMSGFFFVGGGLPGDPANPSKGPHRTPHPFGQLVKKCVPRCFWLKSGVLPGALPRCSSSSALSIIGRTHRVPGWWPAPHVHLVREFCLSYGAGAHPRPAARSCPLLGQPRSTADQRIYPTRFRCIDSTYSLAQLHRGDLLQVAPGPVAFAS